MAAHGGPKGSAPPARALPTTLGYHGQQSLALLLSHHPRCGAACPARRLPPHFLASACRLLLDPRFHQPPALPRTTRGVGPPEDPTLATWEGAGVLRHGTIYDVAVGGKGDGRRESWHFGTSEPDSGPIPMWKDPMMVYAWRSDCRVCLMIGPRSNGVWKMWQGHGEWHQVWSKSNQEAVNDLIIPKQAAAMPLAFAHHQAINNYGEVLRKASLQFENLPQGLLIRFLSGCNEEILITASHNPTIVFTGDKTFSATIPSRCPLYIPTQE